MFHEGQPVAPEGPKWWKHDHGPYDYAHTGFAWAYTRHILDLIGCLFELGGMGSADHHQAMAMVGLGEKSIPGGTSNEYRSAVMSWQDRAMAHINRKIGFVHGTIEHKHHGPKNARGYVSRWDMFVKHGFDPYADLKKNTYGVIEWAGNKPDLEREWHLYLQGRIEDANVVA